MSGRIANVVVVGGGTAGWLSACYLAAARPDLSITLVESPDIATIGVGEGTWPTMRETLSAIGIGEAEFLRECDASFKQGSRFDGWVNGDPPDRYYHPFSAPPAVDVADLLCAWNKATEGRSFAEAMTPQLAACERDLAPRQRAMPDYTGALNYAYHLDAGKFAGLLARHGTKRLGISRFADTVTAVKPGDDRTIASLSLKSGKELAGDLFIDCTGQAALLIGGHFGAEWIDRSDVSFNDRAIAAQVPVPPDSAIASQTVGTAHEAGWLWDIALPQRRGIGCVYSSRFMGDEEAERVLREYIGRAMPGSEPDTISVRNLAFPTGYREHFWIGNCVAIGQSAGFIEPLEASAIVMVELSVRALAANFPATRGSLAFHAKRFNDLFQYRWERIVDFLKLHYVLSERTEPYWTAHRDPATIPPRLAKLLELWRDQPPSAWDFPQVDEVFPAASHQFVLYGMGFPAPASVAPAGALGVADEQLRQVAQRARSLASVLPGNRTYFAASAAPSLASAAT
ncbi:tryptophan halogenase family protein [Tsuneonella mangrovi]|uniref:tryptophan halogenase family protein n=1 Tax=Tsuneonella mangrovi TaxID=1982042 RepID=UPI000BA275B0|nr:tryptophan halogenase family protein [Tsuneonella mangrovi]